MASVQTEYPTVVRTERGLTVDGTRLTIYFLMDYFKADWPPKLVQQIHNLSDRQMADILGYIEAHRDEVEAEYQQILKEAEETRRYWEERNRERFEKMAKTPLTPGQLRLREKLESLRNRSAARAAR